MRICLKSAHIGADTISFMFRVKSKGRDKSFPRLIVSCFFLGWVSTCQSSIKILAVNPCDGLWQSFPSLLSPSCSHPDCDCAKLSSPATNSMGINGTSVQCQADSLGCYPTCLSSITPGDIFKGKLQLWGRFWIVRVSTLCGFLERLKGILYCNKEGFSVQKHTITWGLVLRHYTLLVDNLGYVVF